MKDQYINSKFLQQIFKCIIFDIYKVIIKENEYKEIVYLYNYYCYSIIYKE